MLPATTKNRDLIAGFEKLAGHKAESGGKHKFVRLGNRRFPLPHTDVDRAKLKDLLKAAGVSEEEWMDVI
jgi:hypothetical protein